MYYPSEPISFLPSQNYQPVWTCIYRQILMHIHAYVHTDLIQNSCVHNYMIILMKLYIYTHAEYKYMYVYTEAHIHTYIQTHTHLSISWADFPQDFYASVALLVGDPLQSRGVHLGSRQVNSPFAMENHNQLLVGKSSINAGFSKKLCQFTGGYMNFIYHVRPHLSIYPSIHASIYRYRSKNLSIRLSVSLSSYLFGYRYVQVHTCM